MTTNKLFRLLAILMLLASTAFATLDGLPGRIWRTKSKIDSRETHAIWWYQGESVGFEVTASRKNDSLNLEAATNIEVWLDITAATNAATVYVAEQGTITATNACEFVLTAASSNTVLQPGYYSGYAKAMQNISNRLDQLGVLATYSIEVKALTDSRFADTIGPLHYLSADEVSNALHLADMQLQTNIDVVASNLAAETAQRIASDAGISNVVEGFLNGLSFETSERLAGDWELTNALAAEIDNRIGGDMALSNALENATNEIQSLEDVVNTNLYAYAMATNDLWTAVTNEQAARIGADASLSNTAAGIATALGSETNARIAADAEIRSQYSGATNALWTAVTNEQAARIAADASLSNAWENTTNNLQSLEDEVNTNLHTYSIATNDLWTAITNETAARIGSGASLSNTAAGITTALGSETNARIAADAEIRSQYSGATNALWTAATNEQAARIAADASLSNAWENATNNLQSLEDEVTTNLHTYSIATNDLWTAITNETAARIGSGASLSNTAAGISTALGSETNARIAADGALSNAVADVASDLLLEIDGRQYDDDEEKDSRIAADASLSNLVASAQTAVGAESNRVNSLIVSLGSETNARIQADAALSNETADIRTDLGTVSNMAASAGSDKVSKAGDTMTGDLDMYYNHIMRVDGVYSDEELTSPHLSLIAKQLVDSEPIISWGFGTRILHGIWSNEHLRCGTISGVGSNVTGVQLETLWTAETNTSKLARPDAANGIVWQDEPNWLRADHGGTIASNISMSDADITDVDTLYTAEVRGRTNLLMRGAEGGVATTSGQYGGTGCTAYVVGGQGGDALYSGEHGGPGGDLFVRGGRGGAGQYVGGGDGGNVFISGGGRGTGTVNGAYGYVYMTDLVAPTNGDDAVNKWYADSSDQAISNLLNSLIAAFSSGTNELWAGLSSETAARIGADAAASSTVSALDTEFDTATNELWDAVNTRAGAGSALETRYEEATNDIWTAISNEQNRRERADEDLTNSMLALVTSYEGATSDLWTAISAESSQRHASDAGISNAIADVDTDLDSLEARYADGTNALWSASTNEAAQREASDAGISNSIALTDVQVSALESNFTDGFTTPGIVVADSDLVGAEALQNTDFATNLQWTFSGAAAWDYSNDRVQFGEGNGTAAYTNSADISETYTYRVTLDAWSGGTDYALLLAAGGKTSAVPVSTTANATHTAVVTFATSELRILASNAQAATFVYLDNVSLMQVTSGALNVAGRITAAEFVGDGSGLSGLTSTNIMGEPVASGTPGAGEILQFDGTAWTNTEPTNLVASATVTNDIPWSQITNTPESLVGYGITDGVVNVESDPIWSATSAYYNVAGRTNCQVTRTETGAIIDVTTDLTGGSATNATLVNSVVGDLHITGRSNCTFSIDGTNAYIDAEASSGGGGDAYLSSNQTWVGQQTYLEALAINQTGRTMRIGTTNDSVCVGPSNCNYGSRNYIYGGFNVVTGYYNTVSGWGNDVKSQYGVVDGYDNTVDNASKIVAIGRGIDIYQGSDESVAVGYNHNIDSEKATAVGGSCWAHLGGVALGQNCHAYNYTFAGGVDVFADNLPGYSVGIGVQAGRKQQSGNAYTVAIGPYANYQVVDGDRSISLGGYCMATNSAVAGGYSSYAGSLASAWGYNAHGVGPGSIAVGAQSVVLGDATNAVSVGAGVTNPIAYTTRTLGDHYNDGTHGGGNCYWFADGARLESVGGTGLVYVSYDQLATNNAIYQP